MSRKEAVGGERAPMNLPFSPGVKSGDFLFVSGQGPFGKDGKIVEDNITTQTRVTLENFKRIVEAAGATVDDVVQTTVFLKDLSDYAEMNKVYAMFFAEPRPARATVQAGLLFGMRVEIMGVAHIPNNRT